MYLVWQIIITIISSVVMHVSCIGEGAFDGWRSSHLEFKKGSDGSVQYTFQPCPRGHCNATSPQHVKNISVQFSDDTILCGYGPFVLHETIDLSSSIDSNHVDTYIFYTIHYECVYAPYLSKIKSIEYILPLPNSDSYFLDHMQLYGHAYAIFKARNFGGQHKLGEWTAAIEDAQHSSFLLLGHKTVQHKLKIYKNDGSTEEMYRCFMAPPGSDNSTLCLMEHYEDKVPKIKSVATSWDIVDYTFFKIENGLLVSYLEDGCPQPEENVHMPETSCHQPRGLIEIPRKVTGPQLTTTTTTKSPINREKKDNERFFHSWHLSKLEFRTVEGEIQYVFQPCQDLECSNPREVRPNVQEINVQFAENTTVCGFGPFVLHESDDLTSNDEGTDTHLFYFIKYACADADYLQKIKSIEFVLPVNKGIYLDRMSQDHLGYSVFKEMNFGGKHVTKLALSWFKNAEHASFITIGPQTIQFNIRNWLSIGSYHETYRCFKTPQDTGEVGLCFVKDFGAMLPKVMAEGPSLDITLHSFLKKEERCEAIHDYDTNLNIVNCYKPVGLIELN